jgi:hypothetical protein
MALIYLCVPSQSREYTLISKILELDELFEVVSQFSTNIMTTQQLEQKIQYWKLDISSPNRLHNTLLDLIDLYTKLLSDDEGSLSINALFQALISRILTEKLPFNVVQSLNECRLRFPTNGTMRDLTETLLGTLSRLTTYRTNIQRVQAVENSIYFTPDENDGLEQMDYMYEPALLDPQSQAFGYQQPQLQQQHTGALPKRRRSKKKARQSRNGYVHQDSNGEQDSQLKVMQVMQELMYGAYVNGHNNGSGSLGLTYDK